ncbi:hypothetical protein GA0115255_119502, partial [Streptomyces sp. Ncost-T6T-2b]
MPVASGPSYWERKSSPSWSGVSRPDSPLVRGRRLGGGSVVRGGAFGDGEQAADGPVAEDVLRGEDEPGLAGRADELDGQDAVAAEGEEAVVDADVFGPQEFGEEGGEPAFLVRARRGAGDRGGEAGCREG